MTARTGQRTVKVDCIEPTYLDRESNPNKMEPERYDLLVKAMKRYGCLQPILVEPGSKVGFFKIIDGHHRFWASIDAGLKEILIVNAEDLGDKSIGIALAMNRLRGDLDLTRVADELKSIAIDTDWSMEIISVTTGFTQGEIESLLERTKLAIDERPESSPEPTPEANVNPFVLEISFPDKTAYVLCKKKLKKAAGKGKELYVGLLNVMGEAL
jgi:ParB/RepB/Spo0J family partition protein